MSSLEAIHNLEAGNDMSELPPVNDIDELKVETQPKPSVVQDMTNTALYQHLTAPLPGTSGNVQCTAKRKLSAAESTQSKRVHVDSPIATITSVVSLSGQASEGCAISNCQVDKHATQNNTELKEADLDLDGMKFKCPFRRIDTLQSLRRGYMMKKDQIMEMKLVNDPIYVCPFCVQKCGEMKDSAYDLLTHVALHKGIQNLHCVCNACNKYAFFKHNFTYGR